uniref:Uncharacterized protein n=1 Tax=Onchocerca volvulus TaxID=6282 RepID=A0A8R1TXZ0_ONCVO
MEVMITKSHLLLCDGYESVISHGKNLNNYKIAIDGQNECC